MFCFAFLLLFLAVVNYYIERRKDSPTFLFFSIWCWVTLLFSLQYYKLPISSKTVTIILVMLVAFPLGSCMYSSLSKKKTHKNINDNNPNITSENYNTVLNKHFFWIFCIITIAIMLVDEVVIIAEVLKGKSFLDIIKENGSINTVEISGVKAILYLFIVYPTTYFVSPVCAAEILAGKTSKTPYIIVNVAIIFLAVMHHGARLMIIVTIIVYLFTVYSYGKKISITKSFKNSLKIAIIFATAIIVKLSISRGIDDVIGSFYMYFVCEIPVCDSLLKTDEFTQPAWGYLSFNGLIYPIVAVLKVIRYTPSSLYSYVQSLRIFIENNWIYVEDYGHQVNAFLPAGAFPYIDGGVVFEAIVMLFSGFYSRKMYTKMNMCKSQKNVALYAFLVIGICLSFYRFYLTSYQFVLAMLYVVFMYKKEEKTDG